MVTTINLVFGMIILFAFGMFLHRLAYFIGSNSVIITKIADFIEKVFLKIFCKLDK